MIIVSLLRSSRSMELVLCCYSWLLSIAKEWYISEIVYPTAYEKIKHGAVVEWTLVQVQLQILFTPLLFSCDALVVMASSLPSTLLLVIHCLAWLPFLLTANSSIALWMIREMYFAECLWVMTKHKGAHVNARRHKWSQNPLQYHKFTIISEFLSIRPRVPAFLCIIHDCFCSCWFGSSPLDSVASI